MRTAAATSKGWRPSSSRGGQDRLEAGVGDREGVDAHFPSDDSGAVPLTVFTADGKSTRPELGSGDLFSEQLARDALVLCHKEIESVQKGEVVV
jgi:hypothetical protein